MQYLCQIVDSMKTRTKCTLLLTVAGVFSHSAQDRKGIQQTFIDWMIGWLNETRWYHPLNSWSEGKLSISECLVKGGMEKQNSPWGYPKAARNVIKHSSWRAPPPAPPHPISGLSGEWGTVSTWKQNSGTNPGDCDSLYSFTIVLHLVWLCHAEGPIRLAVFQLLVIINPGAKDPGSILLEGKIHFYLLSHEGMSLFALGLDN